MESDPPSISPVASDGRLLAGQLIAGRYRLDQWIGRGGMGTVWRATDTTLDLPVAMKFLHDVLAQDQAALNDLKRETRRALQLTHPNIVRVHSLVEDPERGLACIAMEFVDGVNLLQWRFRQKLRFFEPTALARWTTQLCDALAYAHEKARIIHRDLKPGNLLLDNEGDLKITDFGIAASANESITRITGSSASGTMSYMSPQQAQGDRPAASDDLYAVGSTLYELLSGEPPFGPDTNYAQLRQEAPTPISERRRMLYGVDAPVPPEWETTIAALLAKRPEERPSTAQEVAVRLGLVANPASARWHEPLRDEQPDHSISASEPVTDGGEPEPTGHETERIPREVLNEIAATVRIEDIPTVPLPRETEHADESMESSESSADSDEAVEAADSSEPPATLRRGFLVGTAIILGCGALALALRRYVVGKPASPNSNEAASTRRVSEKRENARRDAIGSK